MLRGPMFLVLLCPGLVWGAGQRTHVEMGRRALDRYCADVDRMLPGFTDLLADLEARSAYYAGCMFPDWAYGNINNQAAEDAHWKRYQEPYFAYLVEKCPPPWDDDEKKRIAFFFGIVCHGMADLPWHFDKEGHSSLLSQSWAHDRAGHTETEFSYDLMLYQDGTPPGDLIPKLWWPLEDIREVYRRFGTILPAGQLEKSFVRTNTMLAGGPFAASMAVKGLKEKYPWVKDKTDGYYFGGVDHGGALTAVWLKYYYARLIGSRYYQEVPTAVAENNDERIYAGVTDTTLIQSLPDHNTGGEPFLELTGNGPKDDRRVLLRFDVSDWPADKPIQSATLWLYQVDSDGDPPVQPKTVGVYPASSPWTEGVGVTDDINGWKGQPHRDGSATWNSTAGPEDSNAEPIARTTVDAEIAEGRWLSWDVTPLAQKWVKDASTNHGMLLREMDGGAPGVVRVYSSEAFRTQADGLGGGNRIAFRPVLILTP